LYPELMRWEPNKCGLDSSAVVAIASKKTIRQKKITDKNYGTVKLVANETKGHPRDEKDMDFIFTLILRNVRKVPFYAY